MEKGFESWFQDQRIDPNSSSAPFGSRHRLNVPSLGNMLSPNVTNGNLAFLASKPEEPCGWFYGLPRYGQGFTPVVNSISKPQLLEPQKKYVVFDQSNDRTTLIYTSTPIQYHFPKPQFTVDLKKEMPVIEKHEDTRCSNWFLDDGNRVESEMHEDTEELKALLYSDDDDDDDSEDEDEQSTGHWTGLDRHELLDDNNAEDVANSTGCRKRRKLDNGGYDVEDTASSGKSGVNCSGDAEFSSSDENSGTGNRLPHVESEAFPAGKRSRTEKVRETISILENLIPGGKNGKDAMMIIDEAINYLRILKVKAEALGLDSLKL